MSAAAASPELFMYVVGLARIVFPALATLALRFASAFHAASACSANASTAMKPTLCRVRSDSVPGFPRPMMSFILFRRRPSAERFVAVPDLFEFSCHSFHSRALDVPVARGFRHGYDLRFHDDRRPLKSEFITKFLLEEFQP